MYVKSLLYNNFPYLSEDPRRILQGNNVVIGTSLNTPKHHITLDDVVYKYDYDAYDDDDHHDNIISRKGKYKPKQIGGPLLTSTFNSLLNGRIDSWTLG